MRREGVGVGRGSQLRLASKASRSETRQRNRRLVLQAIFDRESVSRADLARTTGLTKPTVSELVAESVESGLVAEVGFGPSAGGKPPKLVTLAEDAMHIGCIDVSGGAPDGALVNLRGEVVERIRLDGSPAGGSDMTAAVGSLASELVARSQTPLLGIGVGTPGLVDERGCVLEASNLDWHDVPLAQLLEDRLATPVRVINDSKAAALAEYAALERPAENLVVVTLGRGIGAGIVIDGRVFFGDGAAAGEIGHVVVADNDVACSCGRRGCLETVASVEAIERATRAHGDRPAATVEAGRQLGRVLAAVVGVLDIHRIVVAGDARHVDAPLLDAIRSELGTSILARIGQAVTVEPATVGSDRVIIGTAAFVLHRELGVTWG